jgi:hypothetical protein
LGKPFDVPSNTSFVETSDSYEVEDALNTFYIEKGNEIIKQDLSYMDLQAKTLSYYNRQFIKKLMEEYKLDDLYDFEKNKEVLEKDKEDK